MIKQSLVIYNLPILFDILNEIKENFKFDLYNFKKKDEILDLKKIELGNYLILTNEQNKIENISNQLILDDFPIKINEIVEKVNIALLRQKYSDQSKVLVGDYILDINSREISYKTKKLKLTEREIDIILFLKNSKNPKSIENLQKEVWGHSSNLETHTVETHIYRLRKKINYNFNNEKFIISTKKGYMIK
tara:strand:+ start:3914 stop:4486 length:573 start_codon:yes stop_codon:yes gene_type:complete